MSYIQIKSGLQFAKIVCIDGKEKIAFGIGEDGTNTMYLDSTRAKSLAFRLLEAVKHTETKCKGVSA
jgi:hypothetical protein